MRNTGKLVTWQVKNFRKQFFRQRRKNPGIKPISRSSGFILKFFRSFLVRSSKSKFGLNDKFGPKNSGRRRV